MRQFSKYFISLFLAAVIIISQVSMVTAKTTEEYLEELEELVELIKENYAGGEVTEKQLYEAAMRGVVAELDKYSQFYNEEEAAAYLESLAGSYVGIGVGIDYINDQIVINQIFDGGSAKDGGMKINDIIYSVDGVVVDADNIDTMVDHIIGEEGTYVRIQVKRGSEIFELNLQRRRIEISTVVEIDLTSYFEERDYDLSKVVTGYKLLSFSENTDEQLIMDVRSDINSGYEYLILDMRGNGGGYVSTAINIARELVPEGVICSVVYSDGTEHTYNSTLKETSLEVVMLLDGDSASATELVSAAIKDSGVGVVIGEQSYGKGVGQTFFDVGEDYKVKMTIFEYFSRNGYKINGIGVTPDVEVDIPEFIYSEDRFYYSDVDPQIKNVEGILKYLGYFNEEPDERYTYETEVAVSKFQEANDLYVYGVCDFGTQHALNAKYEEARALYDIQLIEALNWIENDIVGE